MKTLSLIQFIAILEVLQGAQAYNKPEMHRRRQLGEKPFGSLAIRETAELAVSPNINIAVDCNKLVEQLVGMISTYPTYAVYALGVTAGTALSYNVCKLKNGDDCLHVAGAVASGLGLVVWGGLMVQSPPSQGSTPVTPRAALALRAEWLRSSLEDHIKSRGLAYDSISEPIILAARDESELASHVLMVRGLADEAGATADHRLVIREDGRGHVNIITRGSEPEGPEKRASGSGFKITWEVTDRGDTLPEQPGYNSLCNEGSNDWAQRANTQDMGDYIGLFDFGVDIGKLQYRIIPETGSFSDSYEDVSKCNK